MLSACAAVAGAYVGPGAALPVTRPGARLAAAATATSPPACRIGFSAPPLLHKRLNIFAFRRELHACGANFTRHFTRYFLE